MEPLSEVLALLKPKTYVSPGLDAGGAWALQFPAHEGIKFNAVTQGACWVAVENEAPCHLQQGDCFLLTSGRPFVLTSDLALRPADAHTVYTDGCEGVATCEGGGDFFLVGGRFGFTGEYVDALFGSLPAVVVVRRESDPAPVLRWSLDLFASEVRAARPGGSLMAEHLAHIMLIQVLRLHLSARENVGTGWIFALGDDRLGAALTAMHADLARRWTLGEIGRVAGMSRSAFAERFKKVVGRSPMEYLARWRMQVAGARLRSSGDSIQTIANAVGYESEAAFSTAFKNITGYPPREHRRAAQAVSR